MATVVLKSPGGTSGVNLNTVTVADVFEYDHIFFNQTGTPDELKLSDDALNFTQLKGVGFTGTQSVPDGDVVITGGTVQTMLVKDGGISVFSLTGGNASFLAIYNAAQTNNIAAVFNILLAGNDTISGTAFADAFRGAAGGDTLNGLAGNDSLRGDAGNDTLRGGLGRDYLYGGVNNDIFDFNAVTESGLTVATRDVIADFVHLQDKIDLSTIDAVFGGVNNAFSLLAKDVSPLHNGAVGAGKIGWYWEGAATATTADNFTILKINNDGDPALEMTIAIKGLIALSAVPGVDFIF